MSGYLQGNEMTAGAGAPTPAAVPAPAAPVPATPKAVTVPSLLAMRAAGNKIAMLTCYDASFASLMDRCGVEILLIGDSLGMVCAGYDSTLPVTVADMVYHTASVARGNKSALVLADMPFGSAAAGAGAGTAFAPVAAMSLPCKYELIKINPLKNETSGPRSVIARVRSC